MPALIAVLVLLFSLFAVRNIYFSKENIYHEPPPPHNQEMVKPSGLTEEGQEKNLSPPYSLSDKGREAEENLARYELKKLSEEVAALKKSLLFLPKTSPPPPPPVTDDTPPITSAEIYRIAEGSLVNIFCDDAGRNVYILGSGAIIHSKGYVLTNAHIAENFQKEGIDCMLRLGSPARPYARAELVLLPPQEKKIGGTEIAERDIAILKITSLLSKEPLPDTFEHFTLAPSYEVKEGETLYFLGYPTEFLKGQTIQTNTAILFSLGVVDSIVSVDDNLSDGEGAYLKGEASAQHGSSGGLFLEAKSGRIAGLFVGLTEGKTTAERKQFMFLASYIDEIVRTETGSGMEKFLAERP